MTIATQADLAQAIADWLNRVDLAQRIPDFITLAEAVLNKVYRSTWMVQTLNITITSNSQNASLPADFLEPLYVQMGAAEQLPLEQVSPQQLTVLRRSRLRAKAPNPSFYCCIGRKLEVCPTVNADSTLKVTYYQALLPLVAATDTNWMLTQAPDVYLYTALMHAAPFLQDDQKTAIFGSLVAQTVTRAIQLNQQVVFDTKMPGVSLSSPSDIPVGQGAQQMAVNPG